MTLTNFLLILGSACIHVVAHVGMKRTQNRTAFVWWILLWGGVLFAPLLFLPRPAIPALGWGVMLLSGLLDAGYFAAIAKAYETGDLSVVYPLARGTAPLLTLVWSTLFLHESHRAGGIAGIVIIAVGLYVINLPRLGAWLEPLRELNRPGPRWALLAGLCISGYTTVDKFGVRFADPLFYTYLVIVISWLWLVPYTLWATGWSGLRAELRVSGWVTVLAGFTTLAAYAIVLYAMQNGTPASYAGAVREISVVLGAAIGIFFLKESGSKMRMVGAALVAVGVVVIKFLG